MLLRFGGTERQGTIRDGESRGGKLRGRPAVQMSPEIALSISERNARDQLEIGQINAIANALLPDLAQMTWS